MKPLSKHKLFILWCIIIMTFSMNYSNAQNLLHVSNTRPITLGLTPSFEPGAPVNVISDDTKWLNYTILQSPSEPTYSISVQIVSGTIPAGMEIRVKAGYYMGSSKGNPGRPTRQVTLSYIPQVLISNIGTSYTGTSVKEGHQLTYSVVITNYSVVRASVSPTISILYTISQ